MQLSRILVATDFSEPAQVALRHAVAIAKQQQAELIVLHVYDASVSSAMAFAHEAGTTRLVADLLERDMEQHRMALQNLEAEIRNERVRTSSVFLKGHPDEVISKLATDRNAGLVVLGTHGRTGVARFLLGSVAANVARAALAPVLVARGEAPASFTKILIATDFSPASERALLAAVHLAGPGAHVDVLHCWQSPLAGGRPVAGPDEAEERARRHGEALVARFARPTVSVRFLNRLGTPANGVQEQLETEAYELVCVGSRGQRGLGHLILGSVAETTLRYSSCTVLVTHPPPL